MRYLDPGAVFESSPRREVADVRQIVEEVVASVAAALNGTRIPVTFGTVGQVEGELATLQSLIGQVLISEPSAALEPMSLHADVQGRELHVTLKSKDAGSRSYPSGSYQMASKLDHCQVLGRVDCVVESGKDGGVAEITIAVPLRPMQRRTGFTGPALAGR